MKVIGQIYIANGISKVEMIYIMIVGLGNFITLQFVTSNVFYMKDISPIPSLYLNNKN